MPSASAFALSRETQQLTSAKSPLPTRERCEQPAPHLLEPEAAPGVTQFAGAHTKRRRSYKLLHQCAHYMNSIVCILLACVHYSDRHCHMNVLVVCALFCPNTMVA